MSELLTLDEVAVELRLAEHGVRDGKRWVRSRIASGELGSVPVTKRIRMVSRRQLERYIAKLEAQAVAVVQEAVSDGEPVVVLGLSKRSQSRVAS